MSSFLICLFSVLFSSPVSHANDVGDFAWEQLEKGNFYEVELAAEKLQKSKPDLSSHLFTLIRFAQGRFEDAIVHQKKINTSYPKYGETIMTVLDAYQHLGRYSEAYSFAKNVGLK